jgi:hypothetical protein
VNDYKSIDKTKIKPAEAQRKGNDVIVYAGAKDTKPISEASANTCPVGIVVLADVGYTSYATWTNALYAGVTSVTVALMQHCIPTWIATYKRDFA